MSSSYKHSEAFEKLKSVSERIQGNHSTVQYLRILDAFLLEATASLVEHTKYLDAILAKVLAWSVPNFRRKITMSGKENLTSFVMMFLLEPKAEEKKHLLKEMKLDRIILFYALSNFLDLMEREYLPLVNGETKVRVHGDSFAYCMIRAREIESSLHATKNLAAVYSSTKYWYDHAVDFKHQIIEKYTRLCLMTAQRDYVSFFHHEVDLDDITQTYLYMASRAIDKCDSNQGVLTTHIMNWFMTGRNFLRREREESAHSSQELADSFAVEEDSSSVEISEHVQALARRVDSKGLGRYLLGIEQPLGELLIHKAARTSAAR